MDSDEMKKVKGGYNVYGYDIGILMLESNFPRIIGDVGNALTYDFPVVHRCIKGVLPIDVVRGNNDNIVNLFIIAGKELQNEYGIKALTTSCGFLGKYQNILTDELDIPVFTSSLIQLPTVSQLIRGKKTLIVTADADTLTDEYITNACGDVDRDTYRIVGTQGRTMTEYTVQNRLEVDADQCAKDLIEVIDDVIYSTGGEAVGAIIVYEYAAA